MTDTPQLLLAHHLKSLRLPTFLCEYDKVAKKCAAEGVDHSRYLLRLAELELIDRERRMVERRIKAAKFPTTKSLDSFDFKAMPSLNKMLVMELARCDYITRNENVIAVGNSGTGKTHVALVTSNLPFDEWTSTFSSERLTGALLDRLTHHVHILEMNAESYRLKHSRQSRKA